MPQLIVQNLANNDFAYTNKLQHHKDDFYGQCELFLIIDNTFYPSVHGAKRGCIGIGGVQRMHHQFAKSDIINVIAEDPIPKIAYEVCIKLRIRKKRKNHPTIFIEKDDLVRSIRRQLGPPSFYYYPNQKLLIKWNDELFVGIVEKGIGRMESNNDAMKIVTNDMKIHFVEDEAKCRELFSNDYTFEDLGIGGLDETLSNVLRRALSSRAIKPSIIEKLGVKHVKGMMLHGPPGTGKTLIARNIGKLLSNIEPTIINGPELLNKYVGESEENLRKLFSDAKEAWDNLGINSELHVYIFDEIDAIFRSRGSSGTRSGVTDSMVNQLLTILDGVNELPNVFVIGMTNRLDLIDSALLRPGRLEIKIKIGLPDLEGRAQILRIHTSKMRESNLLETLDYNELAKQMDNFSGAEIESVVKNACSFAINDVLIDEGDVIVTNEHFLQALTEMEPAFGSNLIPAIDNFVETADYEQIMAMLKQDNQLKTILVGGSNKSGKTTLMHQLGADSYAPFVKMIKPIDVIRYSELDRSEYLINLCLDAHLSKHSLILIDDLEVIINFVDLQGSISFSNKLFQTLITMIKTMPENDHQCTIICTTGSAQLSSLLNTYFDHCVDLQKLIY